MSASEGERTSASGCVGDTHNWRRERTSTAALVAGYIEMVDEFCRTLAPANLDAATRLANLPDGIRGFGHVKEAGMMAAQQKREELVDQYRRATAHAAAA